MLDWEIINGHGCGWITDVHPTVDSVKIDSIVVVSLKEHYRIQSIIQMIATPSKTVVSVNPSGYHYGSMPCAQHS